MKSDQTGKKLIVVIGMHRSGTSAITRSLRVLNIALGDRLEPPAAGINDKGYWEDIDIVALNVEMMGAIGAQWHQLEPLRSVDSDRLRSEGYLLRAVELLRSKLADSPCFGFKDPRTAKMLPFWIEVFERGRFDVDFVLAIRNPLSVAQSLAKRDKFPAEKSYLLWVGHMVSSLMLLRGKPLAIVDYDRVLQDADHEIQRLARRLGAEVDPEQLRIYKSDFLDDELRHSLYQPADLLLDDAAAPLAREMYAALLDLACDRIALGDPAIDAKVARWSEEFGRARSALKLADWYGAEAVQREDQIARRDRIIAERDRRVIRLDLAITERDRRIAKLDENVARLDENVARLDEGVTSRDQQLGVRTTQVLALKGMVDHGQREIARLSASLAEIRASTSWRATAPLRVAGSVARRVRQALRVLLRGVSDVDKQGATVRDQGAEQPAPATVAENPAPAPGTEAAAAPTLSIVPYYVDPKDDEAGSTPVAGLAIAIHIHLFHPEMLGEFVSRLASFASQFDVYVSMPEDRDSEAVRSELRAGLPQARDIVIEAVPNRGRDLAPMIVQFGKRLAEYDVIGHFHTKKSSHARTLANWGPQILNALLGAPGNPGGRVSLILRLLQADAKIVYPEGNMHILKDPSGWATNYHLARQALQKYSKIRIEDFPVIDFSEGSMFWARASCLRGFLTMPLSYDDFPAEPIPPDGTLAHALERLVLVFASEHEGKCYRIHKGDSICDYRHYEPQRDYSPTIMRRDVKVLAYYLPQFHPIPENDLWHGKGFTEWAKVRAANPLFEGHYQQHVPHPDIGYYLLDSPDVLRRQADMMRCAGVHGAVFYHYDFGGKLLLQEPAVLLLDNPDIDMPFCFCWANENWTRRWDGDEDQVLLEQKYSAESARALVEYLIPFFRDSRYITIDGRPVLFVYRPASIPDAREYLKIWEVECLKSGLRRPYVVAVLTRGAIDPRAFGMDAGVERTLHDWTAGAVREMKSVLRCYRAFNGSVLSYDDVVRFYMEEVALREFTCFPALVPMWDNTARYGSDAYVVHGSSPQRFQEWLRSSITRARATLSEDRRFVLVNAWNEWAEGAHLEPDSRFGYSYLNSVGRALSSISYGSDVEPAVPLAPHLKVHLSVTDYVREQLGADVDLMRRLISCLRQSTLFDVCSCTVDSSASDVFAELPCPVTDGPVDADYLLDFRRISFFDPTVIERMVQTACQWPGSVVIPNTYGHSVPLSEVTENGSVGPDAAYFAAMVLSSLKRQGEGYRNFRMRSDAHCFVTHPSKRAPKLRPRVTTIIRVHKSASLAALKDALSCLAAMENCVVVPLVATQDLSESQQEELNAIVQAIPFADNVEPQIHHYRSADGRGDLRAKMLNESLHQVKTRYAAFLDYDDLLMSDAYAWLIERLEKTRKAVTFGCIYVTTYDGATGLWFDRNPMYYRGSYEEFMRWNIAPVHAFMLDLHRLDLSRIVYHEDQRYLEDYFLTLQLFTQDNVDWESFTRGKYIGDYIHSVDRPHTLAFINDTERQRVLNGPEYRLCEERITLIQRSLHRTSADAPG